MVHILKVPPPPKEIILPGKAVFFLDCMGTINYTPEDEVENMLKKLKESGIIINNWELSQDKIPFKDEMIFDYLFFDWGGMSVGNSMLEHFAKYFFQDAIDHPNRLYCIISSFTKEAVLEVEYEMSLETDKGKTHNLFYEIDEFIKYIKKYHKILQS